jgi:DNA-directed RNA polymerase specialized sigma24 family protein
MSSNRHEPPTSRRGSAAPAKPYALGDEGRLYAAHADKLRRVVGAAVRTSEANIEDACSFAWLQLLCHQPRRQSVFAWLARVATRQAWRLHRQCARDAHGDGLAALTDGRRDTADRDGIERDELLDTLAALQRLHPRRREMLLLQVAGFSAAEIAARNDITAARARELIYKARLQLASRRRD